MPEEQVVLQQGSYWRAIQAIPAQAISEGMVLLLESIRDVEGEPHTVILRAHPVQYGRRLKVPMEVDSEGKVSTWVDVEMTEHRFLVADFLSGFTPEPEAARVRAAELAAIQAAIAETQAEVATVETSTPESLRLALASGLRGWEERKQLPSGTATILANTEMVTVTPAITAEQVEGMKLAMERKSEVAALRAA